MGARAIMPVDSSPAKRNLLFEAWQAIKQVGGGCVLTLNVLFSLFVLVVATLCAAWLSLEAGNVPANDLSWAYAQLAWLCGCFACAGLYIHLGVLARNWPLLLAVASIGCYAVWLHAGVGVCWVPALLVVGAACGELLVRVCLRWRLALLGEGRRVPGTVAGLLRTVKVIAATTAALCVINLAVVAISGLADVEFPRTGGDSAALRSSS